MSDTRYSAHSLKNNIFHFLSGSVIAGLASLATVILVVRKTPVSDYASYVILTGMIEWMVVVGLLGIEKIIPRYIPDCLANKSTDKAVKIITYVTLTRLIAMLFIAFTVWFLWAELQLIFKLNVTSTTFALFIIYYAGRTFTSHTTNILQSLMDQVSVKHILITQWSIRIVVLLLLVLIYNRLDLTRILFVLVISEWAGAAIGTVSLLGNIRQFNISTYTNTCSDSEFNVKNISLFGLNNYGFTLLGLMSAPSTFRLIVAAFLPKNEVAAFGFISILVERLRQYLPVQMLYTIIEPVFVSRYTKSKSIDVLNEMASILLKINLLFIVPLTAFMYVAGVRVISILTGGKYVGYYWLLCWFLLLIILRFSGRIFHLVLNLTKLDKWLLWAASLSLIVMTLALYLLLPETGVLGIMSAYTLYLLLNNYIQAGVLRKNGVRYHPDIGSQFRIIIYGIVIMLCSKFMQNLIPSNNDFVISFIYGLFIFSTFYGACYIGNIFTNNEKKLLLKVTPWHKS